MSVSAAPPRTRPTVAGARRSSWTGTGHLLRLALRRDRLRTIIWVLAIAATAAITVPSLEATFGDAAGRQARAELLANPAAVMMAGPVFDGPFTLGAMVANEIGLTLMVATAIMSILLVVRHTRAEEESGRSDVVLALAVGRAAPPVAALLAAVVANVAVAAGIVLGLQGHGLPLVDVVAFGLSVASTGLVFAAVAAVTAQLSTSARLASGIALLVLGVAFFVRGFGDVIDASGSALSWFSPIAWAQQTRVFVDLRWWPLALSLAVIVVLIAVAARLGSRRDLGSGLLAGRAGRAAAPAWLSSPAGLAWRLQRGMFCGWAVTLALFAVAFGSLASYLTDALDDVPALAQWMDLDSGRLVEAFSATIILYFALAVVAYAVSAVVRLGREESDGTAALAIVSGPGRLRWLGGWLVMLAAQVLVLLVLCGFAAGLGVALSTGEAGYVGSLTTAALAYLPAVLLLGAVAVALFGGWPRGLAIAWAAFAAVAFLGFFGALLELPSAVLRLSPLEATPAVPAEAVEVGPLVALSAIAAALGLVGLLGFRRRDVEG